MSDLVKRLRVWAKTDTATSEFSPDEHVAWQAADRIAELEAEVKQARKTGSYWKENLNFANTRITELEAENEALRKQQEWQPIETAPKDGAEFLSCGGPEIPKSAMPTKWLSPGPYSTENGKNAHGERRHQYPDGFYWAGYDGFVGPVNPAHWMHKPLPPEAS